MSSPFSEHPAPFPIRLMRAFCAKVIDADTYWIFCDISFHASMTVPVRLRGVNAPELTTPEGKAARLAVQALLEGKPVLLTPFKDRQSFARWIGDVQFYQPETETWQDLAEWLVAQGLAVRV